MKKINLVLVIMLLLSVSGISQVVTSESATKEETPSKADSDKYQVALCNFKTDTLTYEQFKDCSDIKIVSDPQMEVTFYTLVCRVGENDIIQFFGRGNSIEMNIKERMISGGVTEFWLEEMIAKKGDAKVDIGTRKFHLIK